MTYRYNNITISGLPGSGSTTLLKALRATLDESWRGFSGGEYMRQYAIEQGLFDGTGALHHDATVYNEDFDRQVDGSMRKRLQEEKGWILESWLSGFFAQQVPTALKVMVYCSDISVRIDRIVNRDDATVEEAKTHIHARTEKNLEKWSKIYAKEWNEWVVQPGTLKASDPIDFWHPALYDLCIDTFRYSREEVLDQVVTALQAK
jgi:cytidylate kinase